MTPTKRAHSLSAVGKIQTPLSSANDALTILNKSTDQSVKAMAAHQCQTDILKAVTALHELVKQHSLPVPDGFWSQTADDLTISTATVKSSSEPAAVDERMYKKFTARFPGTCPSLSCGNGEIEGTRVVKTNRDRLWHEQCWALEASK